MVRGIVPSCFVCCAFRGNFPEVSGAVQLLQAVQASETLLFLCCSQQIVSHNLGKVRLWLNLSWCGLTSGCAFPSVLGRYRCTLCLALHWKQKGACWRRNWHIYDLWKEFTKLWIGVPVILKKSVRGSSECGTCLLCSVSWLTSDSWWLWSPFHFYIHSTFFVEYHFPVRASKDDKGQVSITTEAIRVASSKITDDGKSIILPLRFSFVDSIS